MIRTALVASLATSIGLLLTVSSVRAAPPVITVPADMMVEATSASGAVVAYSASAVNNVGHPVAVACSPPDGSVASTDFTATVTFPLGATKVTCTVTDSTGTIQSSASFTVIVVDTTPPTLTLPPSATVSTDSPAGTTLEWAATATDIVDGELPAVCSPASGSLFPIGQTTVSCTATDTHGNSSSGSFTVTVNGPGPTQGDVTPPTFSNVPAAQSVEATSPRGATVSYTTPTATDAIDGPIADVRCTPLSGTVFPIAQTTVTCAATDRAGNTGTARFTISVVDTTPPSMSVPAPITVTATDAAGVAATASPVAAFLAGVIVHDLADPAPVVTVDAPARFPVGQTTVTFTARDASGNTTRQGSTVTVVAPSAGAPPPPEPPPPEPPPIAPPTPKPLPLDPPGFKATVDRGTITLRWSLPSFEGFDHVELLRAEAAAGVQAVMLYSGRASTYVDRAVKESQLYRYEIVAVTTAGDRSPGAALTAFTRPLRLLAPLDGAQLRGPAPLRWLPSRGAGYYNVQLYRNGTKVLSTWPTRSSYTVPTRWLYLGRRFRLTNGSYRWYVWPGYGNRSAHSYGALLGSATFSINRR